LRFYLLESGSKGNCFLLEAEDTAIAIDCGGAAGYLKGAFSSVGFKPEQLDALLLTHSHSDHIARLKMFKKNRIFAPFGLEDYDCTPVTPYHLFEIGALRIAPIPLSHDVLTCGYLILYQNQKLVYVTDTGYFRDNDLELIKNADYYIFESNHDPEMLMRTDRPFLLKQRILSDRGHLSNQDSAAILSKVVGENTKQVVLAHLSEEANTPELAYASAREKLPAEIEILLGKQYGIVTGGRKK
jgi:phosphoribosyl 1,2-cyclic phosphodiesterase